MRVLFLGTSPFAIPMLERLVVGGHQVLCCVTQPDRPQGRGLTVLPSPVKETAKRLGIPVEEPRNLHHVVERFQQLTPQVGVVIAYGRLIPPPLLLLPRYGMLGVHPSLLPKYRGASPVAWAILNGDQTTGVSVFRLNERLDAGEIACQQSVAIQPRDTTEQLSARLAMLGADLLLATLQNLEQDQASFHPQDERQASVAPKLTKAHGRIDWHAHAVAIDRLVRAAAPWPGAYTDWRGQLLKLWVTSYDHTPHARSGRAGEVVSIAAEGIAIATGAGTLIIHELQLAGRRRMTAKEFVAGHPIQVGEILGVESGT